MLQSGLVPNVITYCAAISAGEEGEQWQHALGLLAEMQQSGLAPYVITYNGALTACERTAIRPTHLSTFVAFESALKAQAQDGHSANTFIYLGRL
jgi:hypothetical protein